MLNIKIETLVAQIVRQELVNQICRAENLGLYFNFDLRINHNDYPRSYNESRGLHLIYHANPGGSYITVFSGITDSPFAKIKDVDNWRHECSHDSCWRDINVFSATYFDMAAKINEAMVKDLRKEIAPKDMHEYSSFNGFDKAFDWVKCRVKKDETDTNNYRKVLELL